MDPYYNHYTFTSHFYDPDTEWNLLSVVPPLYIKEKDPSAKTEALRFFNLSLAHRYDPNRPVDNTYPVPKDNDPAGYYLGLALHYLTDLGQPMHAANYGNLVPDGTWRHHNFEQTLETHLDKFHWTGPVDRNFVDSKLKDCKSLEDLVRQLAFYSKGIFRDYIGPILKLMPPERGTPWPFESVIPACERVLPEAERSTAAFLLYWARSYDSQVQRIYQRILNREGSVKKEDPNGWKHYIDLLLSGFTPRAMIKEMGAGPEYYDKKLMKITGDDRGIKRREMLYHDFLNRPELNPNATPTADQLKDPTREAWRDIVFTKVVSQEYTDRFGDYCIPGYQGLSELPDREHRA
ncbi:MAG: hypothetical protein ACJ76Y_03145 [Thermoanaerobaculia bacterium]